MAEIKSARDVIGPQREEELKEYIAEVGEFYVKFTDVPQDELVDVIQEFFKRFRPNECVTITWACESGPYRGGGACLISATEDKWNHTGNWAEEQKADFDRRQKSTSKERQ